MKFKLKLNLNLNSATSVRVYTHSNSRSLPFIPLRGTLFVYEYNINVLIYY